MMIADEVLRTEERIALTLRSLYSRAGFTQFKMNKFEEYDLYMKNKEFLISDSVITFNDPNGKLLALKPDVTLSIIKNAKDIPGLVQRWYYTENVYRLSDTDHNYKEIMQTGLECLGDLTQADTLQVVNLALESARHISPKCRMVFSHIGFVNQFLEDWEIREEQVKKAVFEKNRDFLASLCQSQQMQALSALMDIYPDADQALLALKPYTSEAARQTLDAFGENYRQWQAPDTQVDFTLSNAAGYYSGIVFKCYHSEIAKPILSGGEYDHLMRKLGRKSRAVGFAVYLDELERLEEKKEADDWVNIALPKGRLGEKVYNLFEKAGFDCPAIREENRRLIFENPEKKVRYFWVKPSDVAIYVARGAADLGVAGSDILQESQPDVYELCDLKLGKCRMAVAAKKDFVDDETKTLRVATKFTGIAQKFYAQKCRSIDIIHLNGSIELAPLLGLSDVIVDIVETGKTLLENGLEPIEEIVPISARLIANKASFQFKKDIVESIRIAMAKQVKEND